MNTTIETFNCNDEQNNDWEALHYDELVYYCRKNYAYQMKVWEADEDKHLKWILWANKKELVSFIEEAGWKIGMGLKTKPDLQFFLINKINKNDSLCIAKERIITPPTQELVQKIDTELALMRDR